MDATPEPTGPNICPTSVHPPESTMHPPPRGRRKPGPGFPLVQSTGDFRLTATENRPPASQPASDPIDTSAPLVPLVDRSLRPPNATAGIRFRHATWSANRQRVAEGLRGFDTYSHKHDARLCHLPYSYTRDYHQPSRRELRFADCGLRSIVLRSVDDPNRFKIACERCHDRFCLPCMQDRARLIVANLKAQLSYEPTRFLTLTLKHSDDPLQSQLDRLYESFATLRRRGFWGQHVTGGIAFLELKLSPNDNRWHPHLHVLLRGSYLPQQLVRDAWLQITGDSHIIDLTMIKSPEQLYSYLTKYVTKGWDAGMYRDHPRLVEAISALMHRKLLTCFGEFAHLRLLQPPTVETWVELGTLHELYVLRDRGVPWALAAYAAIFTRSFDPPAVDIPDDGW